MISAGDVPAADEALDNRLLRRVDWRFLMPNPLPARSLCLAGGPLARAVGMVSGSVSRSPDGRDGTFDLVVLRNPSRGDLREAWSALRPNGRCYSEWYWPHPSGASRVRQELRRAGFTDTACHWPFPPRMPSQFWLPLDSPATIERVRMRAAEAGAGSAGLAGLARHLVLMASLRAGMTIPICALASKPPNPEAVRGVPSDGDEGRADLDEWLRARWPSWGFGPAPDRLSWMLATGGRRSFNKVVGVVSAASDGVPRVAVKMPRVPESLAALDSEAAILTKVHARRPDGMPGVPRVLFHEVREGFARLGETYLEGVSLFRRLSRDNYRGFALKATDWSIDLASGPERRAPAGWWDQRVAQLLDALSGATGYLPDSNLLRRTREVLKGLDGLPFVCEHRDFSPWNVLVTPQGDLAVLDWESAEMNGLPGMDLIYFLTYLALFHDGAMESGDYLDSYRASLSPSTFTGAVRAECLARYSTALALDPAALRPLGLLVWLTHAAAEYARLSAGTDGRPAREGMTGSPFVAMWQEEVSRSN